MPRKILCSLVIAAAIAAPASAQTAWREKVTAFAADNFKHPAWGASHSRRDYALAKSLAATDGVTLDDDVLFAASYLHDMAAFAPWSEKGKDHSDAAAEKIDVVLAGTDFPAAKLDAVRAAIRTHMYYRDPPAPEAHEVGAPEARYLHDADTLDWLGAIGVTRIVAMAGKMVGPDAIKAIEKNRTDVPPRLFTPAGKAQVPALLAEEDAFLKALRRESGNLADL